MAWRELITPENSGPITFPNLGPVCVCGAGGECLEGVCYLVGE